MSADMILANVMQAIADRLDTIAGLRAFGYPTAKVTPPAAVVAYPDSITYDETYGRGMDRLKLPLVVVVAKVSDRTARDRLGAYMDGSGASSVKAVLESGAYTAFDVVRVVGADFDIVTIAGVEYVAAIFNLDVGGKGSP